ncbi:MAG: hypothetical protein WAW39_28890 [Prosthecobacter sp.]|uniref:hypothetical protein n=1 Tax=Prosthecobacter sp. TaxID=1965333 RepID=UPI003BB11A43
MATKPQTADDVLAIAQTWTAKRTPRTYANYGKFSKAIRHLAGLGWRSTAIVARFIEAGLHPAENKDALYDHVTRFRRNEEI